MSNNLRIIFGNFYFKINNFYCIILKNNLIIIFLLQFTHLKKIKPHLMISIIPWIFEFYVEQDHELCPERDLERFRPIGIFIPNITLLSPFKSQLHSNWIPTFLVGNSFQSFPLNIQTNLLKDLRFFFLWLKWVGPKFRNGLI